jgi:predicted dehydrogenase
MRDLGIGLIGTGFMGKCHALALAAVHRVFGDVPAPRLALLCDTPRDRAVTMAAQFGFARATDDWRALVADPAVDLVSITTPNRLHREMALAAIAAGKHVWCEKPLALSLAEAEEMAEAADRAGVTTMVGYNYVRNPAFTHARRLVEDGVIGRPIHFRGFVDEDYQADPELPWTWRARIEDAGLGALGDLGCHLVSMACGLVGPIESLVADLATVHETRPMPDGGGGGRGRVENEDIASALVRFDNGVHGVLSTSRSAWGRKNRLGWELHGTRGMLAFEQERMNELHLFVNDGPAATQGFRTILTGPAHPPYAAFVPAPGHQLGFNDLKVIEAAALLRALAAGERPYPDFRHALDFERVIHAFAASARTGARVAIAA